MAHNKELDIKMISGIQQIGVGVTNFYEAWKWYITGEDQSATSGALATISIEQHVNNGEPQHVTHFVVTPNSKHRL